jgi:hypothetical protein
MGLGRVNIGLIIAGVGVVPIGILAAFFPNIDSGQVYDCRNNH